MVEEFTKKLEEITASEEYKGFAKEHSDHHLAHGFAQLDKNGNETKGWQIGFYSPSQDNIATFTTNPVKFQGFEKAFKEDDATISELTETERFIETERAIENVKEHIKENHPKERIQTIIVVVQVIDDRQTYNITAVTESFTMIICKINALTGKFISTDKRSVLDLKQE
ncbi:MAG: hypothetical protein ACLFTH_02765 [Candidatus Woesearchaeota archaeon]